MLIDSHVHIGEVQFSSPSSTEWMLKLMDNNDVDKAVLLPLESPESSARYITTDEVFDIVGDHPNRFIPFCSVDPRQLIASPDLRETDGDGHRQLVDRYVGQGARGFGELKCGLPIDDDQMWHLYEICADYDLPVLFHMDQNKCWDDVGLPRLEETLQSFAEVDFIAHAPGWWAHISADVDSLSGYPDSPVVEGGRCNELLTEYDNLYADTSANSGFNALTRDPEYGQQFLERHHNSILFATDFCAPYLDFEHFNLFKMFDLDDEKWKNICHRNVESVLR